MSFSSSDIVLVTGANGHVAQHMISQLLSLSPSPQVRATVRSASSKADVTQAFKKSVQEGQLDLRIVEDITVEDAFDDVLRDVTYIAHIASPLTLNPRSVEDDLLVPAMKGTTSVLHSALNSPTLKSVVITSSFAAAFDPKRGYRPGYVYSSIDWNPITYLEAANPSLDLAQYPAQWQPWITYLASKKLAEEAAWKFYEKNKPRWSLATILPTYIGGPTILPLKKKAVTPNLSFSAGFIWKTALGDGELPEDDFPFWVDVRDVAKAHINALTEPKAYGARWILTAQSFTFKQVIEKFWFFYQVMKLKV